VLSHQAGENVGKTPGKPLLLDPSLLAQGRDLPRQRKAEEKPDGTEPRP
jgi:hypothetical protein